MAAPRAPRGHRARQVVEPTETALEKARQLKKADEQSKLYHQHLIFVKDQVERIAYDNGGSLGSGGGGARRASPQLLPLSVAPPCLRCSLWVPIPRACTTCRESPRV